MTKAPTTMNEDMIKRLAHLLDETNLTEIEYEGEGHRIRVKRSPSPVHYGGQMVAAPGQQPMGAPTPTEQKHGVHNETIAHSPQDLSKHAGAQKSPMVGSAYLSPAPGSEPFVKVGDSVKKGQSIMIIEAMKVMNQIKATKDGVIKQILIHDSEPVEFDQVLMIIE